MLHDARWNGRNCLVSGITVRNDYSEKAHAYAEGHRMNILGATHYSTEKYACIAVTTYFQKMGLSSEFIDDVPIMEDL